MADIEPFLPDSEVERIHDLVSREYPSLRDAVFVTAVDPTHTMFNLMILTPHPKHPTYNLMTDLKGRVADWDAEKKSRLHFVGARADPALVMFRAAAREHVEKVDTARNII
jgi:hypothetical protein